jgi:hypothetical protein
MQPLDVLQHPDDNTQYRYFNWLRKKALARAEQSVRLAIPFKNSRIELKGFVPEARRELMDDWGGKLAQSENRTGKSYRLSMIEEFALLSAIPGQPRRLAATPQGWQPHRFELSVWVDSQLCALALSTPRSANDESGVMPVGLVVGSPQPNHGLRGYIGPAVHYAALEWARVLGLQEIAYQGPFSASGERMLEKLCCNHGARAEPPNEDYGDVMRFKLERNTHGLVPL